ncbi:hypothetical protein MTR_7g063930 [Medicago truncatula]|uniref:Uncharacterized protein n=1 Tax=Medicago truncatula TaxID=3880 RepID=A0A072U071_MEDTR|nr:hypothetical protein MTR_7g063930 [Medicago truncatula]
MKTTFSVKLLGGVFTRLRREKAELRDIGSTTKSFLTMNNADMLLYKESMLPREEFPPSMRTTPSKGNVIKLKRN